VAKFPCASTSGSYCTVLFNLRYIKDCGKIQYLKQLDRFVFDEKKAFKIRPVVIWKNPEQKESISQQWFNALASKSPTL